MKTTLSRLILLLFITTLLGACASAPVFVKPTKRFFWPPEPDVPRIEWIAAYNGDLDIKQQNYMSSIVGLDSSVQFMRPTAVAGDGEGRFVVADQELVQVTMFDLNKHDAFPLGGTVGATSFQQPSGVAVDGDGNFYISDNKTRKIFVVSGANSVLRVIDLSEHTQTIGAIAVDRARARLIVPDVKAGKVIVCNLTGELRMTIQGKGYFSYPNAVAVGSDGSIYIADTFNSTVLRYSAEGKYLNKIGSRGDSPGSLSLITGVALDSEDHVYATDARLHNVTIFDKDGNTLMIVGALHSISSGNIGRGGFMVPQGISIDKNDRIYVADSMNRRVQVLQYLSERYLRENPIIPLKQ